MRIFLLLIVSIIAVLLISSCEKENFPPADPVNSSDTVKFSVFVEPLFNAKCTASGCHGGSVAPNLLTGKSYASLLEGLYVDTLLKKPDGTIDGAASQLMIKLNTTMPPGNPLPKSDISKVQAWIEQGAREN